MSWRSDQQNASLIKRRMSLYQLVVLVAIVFGSCGVVKGSAIGRPQYYEVVRPVLPMNNDMTEDTRAIVSKNT